MSDVNVLLCAVDSVMNALAAFDRDRADVTARVSFALGSVLARVVLETEQCRRALADAESTSYTDEETGNTAENPEAARLRAKLDALEALNERCILAGGALSAVWAQESRQSETHVSDALHRCGVYLKKLNRIALSPDPGSITVPNHGDAPVFVCPPEDKKIFRHEQHKPPNARFGSFAIHAEDFASVIIFRLIRQTRANGRIACLRVYCTIRAGFANAFLHTPTLDIFSPSGV